MKRGKTREAIELIRRLSQNTIHAGEIYELSPNIRSLERNAILSSVRNQFSNDARIVVFIDELVRMITTDPEAEKNRKERLPAVLEGLEHCHTALVVATGIVHPQNPPEVLAAWLLNT